jgi:hypothetical protein
MKRPKEKMSKTRMRRKDQYVRLTMRMRKISTLIVSLSAFLSICIGIVFAFEVLLFGLSTINLFVNPR